MHSRLIASLTAAGTLTGLLFAPGAFAADMDMSTDAVEATTISTVDTPSVPDAYYHDRILREFSKTGLVDFTSVDPFGDRGFDMIEFMSHNCFNPLPGEEWECERSFGPFAHLETILQNGTLRSILEHAGFTGSLDFDSFAEGSFGGSSSALGSGSGSSVNVDTDVDVDTSVDVDVEGIDYLRDRALELQDICTADFSGDALCFIRNRRLIQRSDVEIEGNVY